MTAVKEIEPIPEILDLWNEIKVCIDTMDIDIHKFARGNNAAGARARMGLKVLIVRSRELRRLAINVNRERILGRIDSRKKK